MSRLLSGMRPTGRMHIGHYLSVLLSYVEMQNQHECFFEVADLHVLTTAYDQTCEIKDNVFQMMADWLTAGVDPKKATVFIQSQVPIHYELYTILSMITPTGWLERNPTVKEMVRDLNITESVGHGLLGYPVLQAADILAYKGELVPIGKDQRPHLEIAREIARRFNSLYGETFPEPEEVLREYPLIPGTDGRKMSKSLNNSIFLSDEPDVILKKVLTMVTDTAKVRKNDPGHPDICSVYDLHKTIKTKGLNERAIECQSGSLGCVICKKDLADSLETIIKPLRDKRSHFTNNSSIIWQTLSDGTKKACNATESVWKEVKSKMGIDYA